MNTCQDSSLNSEVDVEFKTNISEFCDLYTTALKQTREMFNDHANPTKKTKQVQLMPISFGMIRTCLGKPEPVTVRILFDSGASKTLVKESFCTKLHTKESTTTAWNTMAGTFHTNKTAKIQFALPEFNDTAVIEHKAHVTKNLGNYDIIVGGDLLKTIEMDIKYVYLWLVELIYYHL